jgi:thiopurine S-methyltransferase
MRLAERVAAVKHEFWLERWEQNQIGFHQAQINRYLTEHWAELGLPDKAGVFVPLCGKSLDMLWLHEQGYPVLGIELSRKAVAAFFAENGLEPGISDAGPFTAFATEGLHVLAGDFFALQPSDLAGIAAVYDRAALIALPEPMRVDYARHMATLLPRGAHILLVTMEYPPGAIEGPPFSVSQQEVHALYAADFRIELKANWEDAAGPRGVPVTERVYSLTRN